MTKCRKFLEIKSLSTTQLKNRNIYNSFFVENLMRHFNVRHWHWFSQRHTTATAQNRVKLDWGTSWGKIYTHIPHKEEMPHIPHEERWLNRTATKRNTGYIGLVFHTNENSVLCLCYSWSEVTANEQIIWRLYLENRAAKVWCSSNSLNVTVLTCSK